MHHSLVHSKATVIFQLIHCTFESLFVVVVHLTKNFCPARAVSTDMQKVTARQDRTLQAISSRPEHRPERLQADSRPHRLEGALPSWVPGHEQERWEHTAPCQRPAGRKPLLQQGAQRGRRLRTAVLFAPTGIRS